MVIQPQTIAMPRVCYGSGKKRGGIGHCERGRCDRLRGVDRNGDINGSELAGFRGEDTQSQLLRVWTAVRQARHWPAGEKLQVAITILVTHKDILSSTKLVARANPHQLVIHGIAPTDQYDDLCLT